MLIPDKSTGDVYTAAEFTPFKNETQNAIISGGEPLDVADTSQLSKRITLAASHDDFYTSVYSSGTATYQLTGPAVRAYPFEYKIGMRVRFIVDTENDASAALIKLGSLASLNVSRTILANGETPVFSIGYFQENNIIDLIYNETPDGLIKYFLIPNDTLSISKLSDGNASLSSASSFNIGSLVDGSCSISNTSLTINKAPGSRYQPQTRILNGAMLYINSASPGDLGGPGDHDVKTIPALFDCVPSSVSTASRISDFSFSTPLQLTGISIQSKIHSTILNFSTDVDGNDRHSMPVICTFYPEDGGTYTDVTITSMSGLGTTGLSGLTNIYNGELLISYDPSFVD